MKLINKIVIFTYSIILFSSLFIYAEDLQSIPVYYKSGDHFSIGTYDIYEGGNDSQFPLMRHQSYLVEEIDTHHLSNNRYRKVIQLNDPESGLKKIFQTRVVDTKGVATVVKSDFSTKIIWQHTRYKHEILLDDGSVLELNGIGSHKNSTDLLPGDIIYFLDERPYDGFDRANFTIRVVRDGQTIGTYGKDLPFVIGPSRKEASNPIYSTLLTFDHIRRAGGSEIYQLWSFDNIPGEWIRNERIKIPAGMKIQLGDQFEPVIQPDDEFLYLKPIGKDVTFEFRRQYKGENLGRRYW